VTDVTPTRSVVLEMKDERRAMHDGYVFLDEKCLLLAGEILLELGRYATLQAEFAREHDHAFDALQSAVLRHGLEGVQVYPPHVPAGAQIECTVRSLMGVRLQEAVLVRGPAAPIDPAVDRSAEADACRERFVALVAVATPLAALAGNLERLQHEYRRAVRRARALQDVLLPELDRNIGELETRLEELDQEDAVWMRRGSVGGT
jgi:V/A-type H+-transporting ATPase subunit D